MALSEVDDPHVVGATRGREAAEAVGLALCGCGFGTAFGLGGGLANDFGTVGGYLIVMVGVLLGFALTRIHIEMFSGVGATLAVVVVVFTGASRLLGGVFEGFDSATAGLLTGMGLWLMARMLRRRADGAVRRRGSRPADRPPAGRLARATLPPALLGLTVAIALRAGNGEADSSLLWATAIIASTWCGLALMRFGGPAEA